MTSFIKGFLGLGGGKAASRSNDFSEFFAKSSGDKAKVIRQVLREANAEQRKVMQGKTV